MAVNMAVFSKDQIPEIINEFGLEIKEGFIYRKNEKIKCYNCDKEITKDNLGNILHGSEIFCCDNIMCFIHYIAERNLEFEKPE